MKLAVYVPVKGTAAHDDLPSGAAIVGNPGFVRNGRTLVSAVVPAGGALGLKGFSDAVMEAGHDQMMVGTSRAGRKHLVDVGHVRRVASYDTDTRSVCDVVEGAALSAWSGEGLDRIAAAGASRAYPSYDEIAEAMRSRRRLELSDDTVALVTEAGQVIRLGGEGGFELLAEDDPRIPASGYGIR